MSKRLLASRSNSEAVTSVCLQAHEEAFYLLAWENLASDLLTPNTPLTTDNHSAPPDVTGLSERSLHHTERPQVASVRGVSRGYNHQTSVMETADGEFPANTQTHGRLPFFLPPPTCCLSLCPLFRQSACQPGTSCWVTVLCCHCNTTTVQPHQKNI